MYRILIATLLLLGSGRKSFAEEQFRSWSEACSAAASVIAEGDLIFLDIPYILFRRVAEGTNSWTSHVGIVLKDEYGAWVVAESTVPLSKKTPLCNYLRRSSDYTFEIKRLNRPLNALDIGKLRTTANAMLDRFYNLGFNFDSNLFFCSKFVYLTYQSIGVEVGRVQTFRELMAENPKVSMTFWKLWFFGSVPWERRTVTPASQLNDSQFFSVLKGGDRVQSAWQNH